MLYVNFKLAPKYVNDKYGFYFMDCKKGEHSVFVPVSENISRPLKEFERRLSIETNNGVPQVVSKNSSSESFFLISTERRLESRARGRLAVLKSQNIKFIGEKYLRSQGVSNIHIAKVKEGDIFRVVWGVGIFNNSSFFLILENKLVEMNDVTLESTYNRLEIDIPFAFEIKKNTICIDANEWVAI